MLFLRHFCGFLPLICRFWYIGDPSRKSLSLFSCFFYCFCDLGRKIITMIISGKE